MLDERLVVQGIEKYYRGKQVFVPFSGKFKPGNIYLFTEANGVGKSTLIKAILGLVKSEGNVSFYAERIAYIPEKVVLPLEMKAGLFLDILGEIKGLSPAQRNKRIATLAQEFSFTEDLAKKIGELSKGMRQKVLLMCAFLREEDLYFFDEALSGLDEETIAHVRKEIIAGKKRGATFLIVTHDAASFQGLGGIDVRLSKC